MYILKKINIAPYVVDLWIIISSTPLQDIPKINKRYPGLNITWDSETAAWTNDHFYEDNILGVAFDLAHFDPDTVAHEAVHIVNRTYSHAGATLSLQNDEPQAYLTGWVVGEIYKTHKKFMKKHGNS